jgi:hypothetical protein
MKKIEIQINMLNAFDLIDKVMASYLFIHNPLNYYAFTHMYMIYIYIYIVHIMYGRCLLFIY